MNLTQQQKDFLKWAKEEGEMKYEEEKMLHNGKVVASFMEHCEENGLDIPESYFESYFGA